MYKRQGFQGQSQERIKNFNQWTLDATYGLSIPFGSSKVSYNPDAASFISFTNVTIGGRYNFTEDWGVATHMTIVGYHGDGIGTNNFRLDAQAYYNLGRLTGLLSSSNEKFGLLAHSGFGVTWSKSCLLYTSRCV